jgi:3-hydroxyisobutyrate dehydrogenase-like beta-hydroxyacid dehydrogenase
MPEIGVVGLGWMGLPVCANLVRAGYRVLAGDRRAQAARQAALRPGTTWTAASSLERPDGVVQPPGFCGLGRVRTSTP